MKLVLSLAIGLLSLAPAWGQLCSNETTRGTYGLVCSGYLSPATGAPQLPFSAIGTVKIDAGGSAVGGGKVSLGGVTLDQAVTGTATLNGDCTGTVVYDQKLNGQPAGKLNIAYHVLDNGKEIRGMSTDPGATMICNLRMISK